ncbi:MAG: MFS transporter [Nocardioides sp.]|nr:MFS transporter [Nocardioides sp.]
MTGLQIRAVVVATLIVVVEGFEVAMLSFVAKPMAEQWHVSDSTLGVALSTSLFGMAAGALLFSPVGDRFGRRPLTTGAMVSVVLGMLLSVAAPNIGTLIVARLLVGLGIGAMAQLNAYVSEFASDKRRGLVVGIYAAAVPFGAVLCGITAGALIDSAGWRWVFVVGSVFAAILLVVTWIGLPESVDFLVARRPKNALERVNALLAKMGRPTLTELPEHTPEEKQRQRLREIFTGTTGLRTLALWLGYGGLMAAYYFAVSWVPKLVAESTGDDKLGTTVGTVLNLGGIVGSLLFAAFALKIVPRAILIATLSASAIGFAVYGAAFGIGWLAIVLGIALGLLTVAAVAAFYTVAPTVYPAGLRASGVGWTLGVGRLVSIVSPLGTGFLLDNGWHPGSVFYLMALPLAISAVCAVVLARTRKPGEAETVPTFAARSNVA